MICARKEEFTSRRPLALASSRVWNTPDLPVIGIKRWSQLEMKDRNKSKLIKGIEMKVKSIRQVNDWVRMQVIDWVHVRVCEEEGKWWYPWNYSCINIRNMNNEFDWLRIWSITNLINLLTVWFAVYKVDTLLIVYITKKINFNIQLGRRQRNKISKSL